MGKQRAEKHNWRHMMIISFIFYAVIVGGNEVVINKTNLVNDTVSMHCDTEVSIDVHWHFNSISNLFYALRRFYDYGDRLRMEKYDNGTYILIISKVRSEDAGWYNCSEEISGRPISSTHLTVLDSSPVCHYNMKPHGFVGPNTCCNLEEDHMVFSCTVSFNGNRPDLIWRSLIGSQYLSSSFCKDQPNRRSCSLILKSNKAYDGSSFICQTASSSGTSYNCSTEIIKVQYFSATYGVTENKVNETVECTVQSNVNVRYKWNLIQVNKEINLGSDRSLLIPEPGLYQCEVQYTIKNVSCVFVVSTVTASFEAALPYTTTSGTTTMVIVLLAVFVFVAFFSAGIIIWILKRRKDLRCALRVPSASLEKTSQKEKMLSR